LECHRYLLYGICLLLSGCYYARDIRYQTLGSGAGGMSTGIALVESSIATTTAGAIGGSMLGSMLGQHLDNYSPLATDNPVYSPVHRYCYQVVRPYLEVDCFQTGRIYDRYSDRLPSLTFAQPPVNQLD